MTVPKNWSMFFRVAMGFHLVAEFAARSFEISPQRVDPFLPFQMTTFAHAMLLLSTSGALT